MVEVIRQVKAFMLEVYHLILPVEERVVVELVAITMEERLERLVQSI